MFWCCNQSPWPDTSLRGAAARAAHSGQCCVSPWWHLAALYIVSVAAYHGMHIDEASDGSRQVLAGEPSENAAAVGAGACRRRRRRCCCRGHCCGGSGAGCYCGDGCRQRCRLHPPPLLPVLRRSPLLLLQQTLLVLLQELARSATSAHDAASSHLPWAWLSWGGANRRPAPLLPRGKRSQQASRGRAYTYLPVHSSRTFSFT